MFNISDERWDALKAATPTLPSRAAITAGLTPAQAAATAHDGAILVLAGAGSPPELDTKASTNSFNRGTKLLSIQSFLSTQAVRSTNCLDGIDHCLSNNSTVCAVKSITVPLLVMGMGGYLFIRDSEDEFEAASSHDKDLVYIEGATHSFTPCTACGSPGAYSNSVTNLFDCLASWTRQHFGKRD